MTSQQGIRDPPPRDQGRDEPVDGMHPFGLSTGPLVVQRDGERPGGDDARNSSGASVSILTRATPACVHERKSAPRVRDRARGGRAVSASFGRMTNNELAAFYRRYNACCNEHRFDDVAGAVRTDFYLLDAATSHHLQGA